jgi:hypothetical protein
MTIQRFSTQRLTALTTSEVDRACRTAVGGDGGMNDPHEEPCVFRVERSRESCSGGKICFNSLIPFSTELKLVESYVADEEEEAGKEEG